MSLARALPVFTISYCLAYPLVFRFGLQLFSYYPAIGEMAYFPLPKSAGTPIYLYGWVATAALFALVMSALFLLVPQRWGVQLWPGWSWLVPLGALLFILYTARIWLI